MIYYTFCSHTDTGRARNNNEDSVAFDAPTQHGVLADGMGGYNAGEVAAGMATDLITSSLTSWLAGTGHRLTAQQVRQQIELCVDHANDSIYQAAQVNPAYAGMGTTLVLAVFRNARLLLGHIGDSRCYRLRGKRLTQITKDHSLLQEYLDGGFLSRAQMAFAPNKNLVTRALGVEPAVSIELHEHAVAVGDIYLICSDGLSDMVDDAAIASILCQDTPLNQMAHELVSTANDNGGQDNITVLLAKATDSPDRSQPASRTSPMQ